MGNGTGKLRLFKVKDYKIKEVSSSVCFPKAVS